MDIWNYDLQIVFHTAELSTNSLGEFVAFRNYDFHTVFHTSEPSQPIPLWILWCFGIMITVQS